jgi:hypothetical protein
MTTPDAYFLVLVTGNEGPFTPDELRDLVRRGRARAGDRLYDPTSHTTSEIRHVVPDADTLEKTATRPSDRILRTTSDRKQAIVQVQAERRRTIDRLPSVDAAPQAPTPSSDGQAAISPPDPTATTEGQQTSDLSPSLQIPGEDRNASFRTTVIGGLLLAAMVWVYVVWFPGDRGGGILHPPPTIPVLSPEELATLPDHQLLERVELECLRRLFAANKGPHAAASVLSPPASHLWIIGSGETQLRSVGLRHALMIERAPELSPIMPTFKQMASAYRAMELLGPAQALEEALRIDDPGNDDNPYMAVQQHYMTEIAARSAATRLAFARAHRHALFPTP